MIFEHWFWLLLTAAALIWYSTVTLYVAVKGTLDIREMLRKLGDRHRADQGENTDRGP